MSKNSSSKNKDRKLSSPHKQFRTLFGAMSLILLMVTLHILFYSTFITYNTPNCANCDPNHDKSCYTYCDTLLDNFIPVTDLNERNNLFAYFCFNLIIRCIALISGFIGVFVFSFFLMAVYIVLYFSLTIGLTINFVMILIQDKFLSYESVYSYLFGKTTITAIICGTFYATEALVFAMGSVLTHKYLTLKYSKVSTTESE